jgi:hypothetical protein
MPEASRRLLKTCRGGHVSAVLLDSLRCGYVREYPSRMLVTDVVVWTTQRVEAWQQTGERPSVAVWTTEQTATFLSFVTNDRLAVMWWLTALRGLRRGVSAA